MTERSTAFHNSTHPGIFVLGMHRSGTSAVAGVLAAAGAYAGDDNELLPAHPDDNPAGYWERVDLVVEHDRFLHSVGHAWDRAAGFDTTTLDPENVASLRKNLQKTLTALNGHGTPWLVKDPRLSLLLPLWLPLLDQVAFVVVVRDPREIAVSLRDTHRGVLTSQFGILLWEKYLRSLLDTLHGKRVLFVSYQRLLDDPQPESERLVRGLAALGVTNLKALTSPTITPDLHRNRAVAHVMLTDSQAELYKWLDAQTRSEEPVLVGGVPHGLRPDAALAEFEAAFAYHIERGRQTSNVEVRQRLDRLAATLEENIRERDRQSEMHANEKRALLDNHLQQTRLLVDAHSRTTDELNHERRQSALFQQQVDEMRRKRELDDARMHEFASDNALLRQQTTELDRHAGALEASLSAMRHSWSWTLSAPLRWPGAIRSPRLPWNMEQKLYRWYYAFPGISHARKHAFILWLHKHAAGLTRGTMSYQLRQRSQQYSGPASKAEREKRAPRMDEVRAAALLEELPHQPLISIAVPVYNIDARWLKLAVDSVRAQYYPHWELCLADDASTKLETLQFLDELASENDLRIKIVRLTQNVGIARASNAALELASGDYIGLLDHDDELTRDALLEVARVIVADNPDLIYSDEDKTDESNDRRDPFFKPDYSPEYFLSNNYLCHFTVMRADILKRIGGFRTGVDGAQDFDLFLRFTAAGPRVSHISKVLYHWRMITGSTAAAASAKPYTWEAGRDALTHRLSLSNTDAKAELGPYPNTYRIRYTIRGNPLVSILIPFRDRPELLDVCVRSILEKTDYENFEIVGIDNGSNDPTMRHLRTAFERRDSRIRFIDYPTAFNYSAINNFGAQHARGEHLLLLNNDTEVITPEWLRAMLEHSQRDEVGVVGAKLLYPDDTVQHAGVIIDRTVVAMHPHQFLPREHPGYAARPHLLQNLSAVTFACAMTRRDVFEKLNGLNETDLPICFNDVDYCLRAREKGYLVVFTPYAVLRHFESKSRGFDESADKRIRFRAEFDYMQRRHAEILARGDPFYNPNLSLGVQDGFHADPYYAEELPQ